VHASFSSRLSGSGIQSFSRNPSILELICSLLIGSAAHHRRRGPEAIATLGAGTSQGRRPRRHHRPRRAQRRRRRRRSWRGCDSARPAPASCRGPGVPHPHMMRAGTGLIPPPTSDPGATTAQPGRLLLIRSSSPRSQPFFRSFVILPQPNNPIIPPIGILETPIETQMPTPIGL